MNTSEVLDLTKENIQPLKQGRNAVKLGTALQAQTNAELHQKLLAEREQFELSIRMYEGDDPLKPHYDYVLWIEQSFPKHGPESNLLQILENTLTTFKDDERYKQDLRYADLLIKYIDTQPNPVEIYQLVYDQGLCTMCAPFYKAWADELDKNNDVKNADQVYELGIRVKAQPLELLPEAHLRFQLNVGRRMLGRQEEASEVETDYNRQALHKLQKKNTYSARDPAGVPGRIKQNVLGNNNMQNSAPFKLYQGDEKEHSSYSESHGKMFPKQSLLSKENVLKPGPWSQNGGKHRIHNQMPTTPTPAFQVHKDEGADIRSSHYKTPCVPRALKTRKIDKFSCPLFVADEQDETMKPMYCKNKVYAGSREFQFEELRAAVYNRRFEQLAVLKMKKESEIKEINENISEEDDPELPGIKGVEEIQDVEERSTGSEIKQETQKDSSFHSQNVERLVFDCKSAPLEVNTSLFHCQSFTVNTKEAMNVVQEMWNSPSPAPPAFGNNVRSSRAYLSSPVGLDESGVFKVPAVPPTPSKAEDDNTPLLAPQSVKKNIQSFSIYSDEELPAKTSQPFQVYTDDVVPDQAQPKTSNGIDSEIIQPEKRNENAHLTAQLFNPFIKPTAAPLNEGGIFPPGSDAATIKMLAFQSDSEDSGDDILIHQKKKVENVQSGNPSDLAPILPSVVSTAPTPMMETNRKSLGVVSVPQPVFHDEDRYEDITCNTKAFDFALPSSTPLIGHFKPSSGHPVKSSINGSYISEDLKKCNTKQDLSMIFEASKERYSSSSGSSGSKTQGSVCTVANSSVQHAQAELIDKLAQISANKSLEEELEKSFGFLTLSGPVDPFSTGLITQLLSHIGYPKKHHLIGLHIFDTDAPALHTNSTVKLGIIKYSVIGELGKGNYARVLKATRDGQPVALKQQRPAWEWEWYIVQELQSRLPPNMMSGYLHMSNGYIYKNASILESEWGQYGSILSVVNKLKISGKGHDLHLALLFSIQLISIVEHLHKCKIIHGDIKPDNFVLCALPTTQNTEPCLKLIDFGRSIDMTLFPEGTTFTTVVTTDGFQCNEMKEGRCWTYQTDLYGLAGSIYCILFYDYMKVVKKDKKWQLSNKIPRYMMPAVWQEVFTSLLNVESCENLPNLAAMRDTLEQRYKTMDSSTINLSINKLTNVLLNK